MTRISRLFFLMCFILGLVGCSTIPKPSDDESASPAPGRMDKVQPRGSRTDGPPADSVPPLDLDALKRSLGLGRARTQLGYEERVFEGCGQQFGMESGRCQRSFLVSVQFRLMCRDSEGTVSVAIAPEDLAPVGNQALVWSAKSQSGDTQTDSDGFGEIVFVSSQSQRQQRLKISNGTDFLYLNAGDVGRLVTPVNWCTSTGR